MICGEAYLDEFTYLQKFNLGRIVGVNVETFQVWFEHTLEKRTVYVNRMGEKMNKNLQAVFIIITRMRTDKKCRITKDNILVLPKKNYSTIELPALTWTSILIAIGDGQMNSREYTIPKTSIVYNQNLHKLRFEVINFSMNQR